MKMEKNLKEYKLVNLGNYIQFVNKKGDGDELGFSSTYGLINDIGSKNKVIELKNASSFATYYDSTYDVADGNKTKLLRVYIKNIPGAYEVFPVIYNLRDGSILSKTDTYTIKKNDCGPFKFCPRGCCYYLNPKTKISVYHNLGSYWDMFLVIYQGLLQNKLLRKKERFRKNKRKRPIVLLRAYPDITMNIMKFLY